ncbi:MAG: biosynthetic peptidoglycan transglycosylase [Eubacteriales bacterium]|nr:biosynthetic peptidoglycan transglycosylase [Eubacteriales bacterium]
MDMLPVYILFGASAAFIPGFSGILLYARRLMRKRPLRDLYDARSKEADFIPLASIPERLRYYVVQIEDPYFFKHSGISKAKTLDAVLMNLRSGTILSGGSSISQQLAKNLYFRFHHSYLRKAAEFIIALTAERSLGKEKILELYLNIIYYGNGIYGITHAARFYFGKKVQDLTRNQMFLLASLIYAPTMSNPLLYPDVLARIRDRRIGTLLERDAISTEEAELFRSFPPEALDPELREEDGFAARYPQEVCLNNDRFGPYPRKERVTIPE